MRVDYIEDDIVYYTSVMGSGEEMNRLIKRLWKNPYYDFSFSEKSQCMLNRVYQMNIIYNNFTSRYDVSLVGQETVFVFLKDTNIKITNTTTYSCGKGEIQQC